MVRGEEIDEYIVFSTLFVEEVAAEELAGPPGPRSNNRMLPVVKLFVYATFRGPSVFEVGLLPEKKRFVDKEFAFIDLECLQSLVERDFGSPSWDHSLCFIFDCIIALS